MRFRTPKRPVDLLSCAMSDAGLSSRRIVVGGLISVGLPGPWILFGADAIARLSQQLGDACAAVVGVCCDGRQCIGRARTLQW